MNENIIIQESGEPKALTSISKVVTSKADGGSANWVLFEGLDLISKTITKNGTYKAEDETAYGFYKVTVKVPKKGKKKTGKKPKSGSGSSDPNDYEVTRDDNGDLIYTKIPSSINIVTPPSKTGYHANEDIDLSGIVVKAYFADGTEWGTVPVNELSISPKKAGSAQDISATNGGTYISGAGVYLGRVRTRQFYKANDGGCVAVWSDGSYLYDGWTGPILFATTQEAAQTNNSGPRQIQYHGVTLYCNHGYFLQEERDWDSPLPRFVPSQKLNQDFVLLAEELGIVVNSNTVKVTWHRPSDEKALSDTFHITVA